MVGAIKVFRFQLHPSKEIWRDTSVSPNKFCRIVDRGETLKLTQLFT
jgi:hypothetical protein